MWATASYEIAMHKTVISPGAGQSREIFQQSETKEQAHSKGVVVRHDGYDRVYLSGIIPTDDEGKAMAPGDIGTQTRLGLKEIEATLEEHGGKMEDIVRVRVYIVDYNADDFREVHKVRQEFFDREHYPASTLVEVANLVRDGARIEIDAEAIIPDDGWDLEVITD